MSSPWGGRDDDSGAIAPQPTCYRAPIPGSASPLYHTPFGIPTVTNIALSSHPTQKLPDSADIGRWDRASPTAPPGLRPVPGAPFPQLPANPSLGCLLHSPGRSLVSPRPPPPVMGRLFLGPSKPSSGPQPGPGLKPTPRARPETEGQVRNQV